MMSEQKKMNERNETIVQEVQKERVVMGFCALKGYQILAGGFSLKAIAICAILMIVMVYLSNWVSYALAVAEVYETDIILKISFSERIYKFSVKFLTNELQKVAKNGQNLIKN